MPAFILQNYVRTNENKEKCGDNRDWRLCTGYSFK